MNLALALVVSAMVVGSLALPYATWRSAAALVICLCLVGAAVVTALGQPRPAWTELKAIGNAHVVGAVFDEPNHIFLWLQKDGGTPISYAFPWSEAEAAQLQEAMQQAQKDGRGVEVQGHASALSQGDAEQGAMKFYEAPQKPNPPKTLG